MTTLNVSLTLVFLIVREFILPKSTTPSAGSQININKAVKDMILFNPTNPEGQIFVCVYSSCATHTFKLRAIYSSQVTQGFIYSIGIFSQFNIQLYTYWKGY